MTAYNINGFNIFLLYFVWIWKFHSCRCIEWSFLFFYNRSKETAAAVIGYVDKSLLQFEV